MLDFSSTGLDTNSEQLLLNYHFGHKNSSIMFFPLNHAFTINHNSKRSFTGKAPNVRVEFSRRERRSRYFLDRSLEDLKAEKYSTMVLDFVAIRDIKPDEEIFLDYGEEWEEAWNKHVSEWSSPCGYFSGTSCFESSMLVDRMMNADKFNSLYHDWSEHHYSSCQVASATLNKMVTEGKAVVLTKEVPKSFDAAMDTRIKQQYEGITAEDPGFKLPANGNYRPCKILANRPGVREFDVLVYLGDPGHFAGKLPQAKGGKVLLKVEKLSADNLRFVSKPLKADMFYPKAFRHEIIMPDESFPELWRDLESK